MIHAANDAPLSIVIVGIGNADFRAMQFLEDFQSNGAGGGRDICMFVEFNRFRNNKAALEDYFQSRAVAPLSPQCGSANSSVASESDDEEDGMVVFVSPERHTTGEEFARERWVESRYAMPSLRDRVSCDRSPLEKTPCPATPSLHAMQYSQTRLVTAQRQRQAPPLYDSSSPAAPAKHLSCPIVSAAPFFEVRLPPTVRPGMQVPVQNPVTHQNMIVVVPHEVPVGGSSSVTY